MGNELPASIPTRATATTTEHASRTPQHLATTTALALTSALSTLFAVAQLSKAHPPHYLWAVLAAGLATTALLLDLALVALCGAMPVRVLALVFCTVATLVSFAFACVWGGQTWAVYAGCGGATVVAAYRVVTLWPRQREGEQAARSEQESMVGKTAAKQDGTDMCCESRLSDPLLTLQSVLYPKTPIQFSCIRDARYTKPRRRV
ncbi:uncharacterized protein LOC62_02G002704 [Vanrija pseudolonga]|uniref:Uncharacterized protein n=1 Tax=Vanrija pseudolonga TaxID=143232 RepID=A0AAF1BIV8_9TREE|nr:hypothetical protein LOC62_02G002704 [Vanrija pseudolonga]